MGYNPIHGPKCRCHMRNLSCQTDCVCVCGLSVDGNTRHPIKTDLNRVIATLSSAGTHAQTGQLYSVMINIDSTENEIVQVLFNNTSSQTMYLDKIICSSIVTPETTPRNYVNSVQVAIIKNVTITASGTPLTPANYNAAFPDASSLSVSQNPSAISGTVIFNTRPASEYFTIDFDGRVVVPPEGNIIIQFVLTNPPSGLGVNFWSTMIWYEL